MLSGLPTVTGIMPNYGPTTGGTSVTISGTNLSTVTTVDFGAMASPTFSYNPSTNQITAVAPPESAGQVDIILVASGIGSSSPTSADHFSFIAGSNTTTTSLASSANPAMAGQPVTFTATVSAASGTPTGTITFYDGNTMLGTGTLALVNGFDQATLATSSLAQGAHSLTAVYGGDSIYGGSTSSALGETIQPAGTTTSLSSSANPATPGQAVTFTATVNAAGGTPSGTVTFYDGGTMLGTGTLALVNGFDQATFTTSSLSAGSHSITASYAGGGNFAGSTSAVLTENIQLATTFTSLSSSANPVAPGQAVTFTATVSSAGSTPGGTVTFYDGGTMLGTGTLALVNGFDQATLTTSTLSVGSHSITAVYAGSSNYAGSTSSALTETVQLVSTLTSVSSSANPSAPGQSVTLTATVSAAGGGIPTGIVTFYDGSTALGTGTLTLVNAIDQATFTTSSLAVGSHSITAVYGGNNTYATSTSSALSQMVQLLSSFTSLSSSDPSTWDGQPVTLTATVTGAGGGTPTGTVTFYDGTTSLGTATLDVVNGLDQASFTTSALSAGNHSITAVYGGDGTYAGSTSPILGETVQAAGTSTALTSSAAPAAPGQAVTLTATVSAGSGTPTGAVTFYDGSTALGTGTLALVNGFDQATFTTSSLAVGTHSLTAVYGGDSNYAGSTSAVFGELVQQLGTVTALASSANPAAPGVALTLTATITGADGGTPTGTITFYDGTTALGTATVGPMAGGAEATFTPSGLAAGFHALSAAYSGDTTYTGSSSATLGQVVDQDQTSTALSASADPAAPGQSVTLTAIVTGQGTGTPTGTVTFYDGSTALGTGTLALANGFDQATLTTSSLAVGSHSLTAVYGGDSNDAGSSSSSLEEMVQAVATFASISSSASQAALGQAVTFTATVGAADNSTPGGVVTFSDGSNVLGTGTLALVNGLDQATFTTSSLAAGSHTITAAYAGGGSYAGSSASLSQGVAPNAAATTFTSVASWTDPAAPGDSVTFTATVSAAGGGSPTGTVTFYDGTTALGTATLSGGLWGADASFATSALAAGLHAITAVYGGDNTFAGSTSATLGETIQLVGSNTTLFSTATSLAPGQAMTLTAAVLGADGGTPSGTVTFYDGSTALGTATLDTAAFGAQATLTTSSLAAGSHILTALYGGDGTYAGSTSASVGATVQLAGTSTSLTSSADPAASGQAVTLTATVSPVDGGTPTGTITFYDGTTSLGTATLAASLTGAQATLTTSTLTAGPHSLSAAYGGDSTYAGSTSATLGQTVNTAATSTSLSSSANPAAPGQAVTLTATVLGSAGGTPTGAVTFYDGSTVLGTATLAAASSGAQASFTTSGLAAGSHALTAVYGGDSSFASSTGMLSQVVGQSTTTTSYTSVSSSANPGIPGQAVTFTATVLGAAGGVPSGTAAFYDGTTLLGSAALSAAASGGAQAVFSTSSLAVGAHSITAVYGGDGSNAGSTSAALVETLQLGGTFTSLASSAVPAAPGQTVTLTATVSGAGGGIPIGTVTFYDGSAALGTGTLELVNGLNQATFTTSSLAAGSHTLTAVYGGDSSYAGSTSAALAQGIQQVGSTIAIASSVASAAVPGQAVTLTATVLGDEGGVPTGTVTFYDGTTALGTGTLSAAETGAQASFTASTLAAGSHSLTAVYGGDSSFTASTSDALTQVMQQAGTFTSLTSSSATADPGQTVTFTVTVVGMTAGTPSGTITLYDGTAVLGTTTLSAGTLGAQATFTASNLVAGTHAITATYGGDSAFTGSSAALSQVVGQSTAGSSFTSLASSAEVAAPGQTVTLTATVSGQGNGTPTGTVTFYDGTTVLGSAILSASQSDAEASLTLSTLATGPHAILAIYSGDSNFAGSTSDTLTQTVQLADTSIALASSADTATPGEGLTLTATVSADAGGTPTGTVTFYDGNIVLGTGTLALVNGQDQATFTTSALAAGTHSLTAVYGRDSTFAVSTSDVLRQPVQQAASTVTLVSSAATAAPGQAITFTATVSAEASSMPTGTVTFYDGSTALGTGTLALVNGQDQATFTTSTLTTGDHTVTAVYGGDNAFFGSISTPLGETVQAASTYTALASSANPASAGQSITLTATVLGSGGTPTGTVTFYDGSTELGTSTLALANGLDQAAFTTSALTTGTHSLSAVYDGDSTYASSSATLSQVVGQAAGATSLTSLFSTATTAAPGQAVTLTAVVKGTSGGMPTGTVTFYDGSTQLGTGALTQVNGQQQATFTTSTLALGSHSLTAVYGGDGTFAGSTSAALNETVQNAATTTTLTSSTDTPAPGQSLTLTATVTSANGGTPTGTVTFYDGATALGTASLAVVGTDNQATLTTTLASGTHSLTAVYGGDNTNAGSTSAALTPTVQQLSTTAALSASADPASPGQAVTFTAAITADSSDSSDSPDVVGTPTGTVTFYDGTTVLGTATLSDDGSGDEASLTVSTLAVGTHSITAVYGGDTTYAGSTADAVSETIQQVDSIVALASSAPVAIPGQAVTFTASLTGGDGGTPTGTVTFYDGTTALGTASLAVVGSQDLASFTTTAVAAGSHSITAVYSGDTTYASSTSAALTETLQQAGTSTALASSVDTAAPGQSLTLTATVSGSSSGTPTGTVTFYDGSTALGTGTLALANGFDQATFTTSALAAGSHSLTAAYGGDVGFTGSTSSALTETIQLGNTTTSVVASADPVAPGQAVTLTATVSGDNNGTPTGTVTFYDGTTALGTGTLALANGLDQATFTTSTLAAGSHSVTAVYGGDSSFNGSTSDALGETVQTAATFTTLASSADPAALGQDVTLTATVNAPGSGTPTGMVTFYDGTMALGTATLTAAASGLPGLSSA